MKNAKKISTILFSGYLILAMGGFGIFHHYCGCSSEQFENTSILVEQSCCSPSMDDFGFENQMVCHSDSENMSCGDDGCNDCNCNTQVEVLKLDYTIQSNHSVFDYSKLYELHNSQFVLVDNVIESKENDSEKIFNIDKSPPKAGKFLVILHQSIKIPFSIS